MKYLILFFISTILFADMLIDEENLAKYHAGQVPTIYNKKCPNGKVCYRRINGLCESFDVCKIENGQLVTDAVLKAAKDAIIAAQDAERVTRLSKEQQFLLNMKDTCLPALNNSPTQQQRINCLKTLMKYVIRSNLDVGAL